jgi:serine/threonine protein kinase
MTDRIGRFEIRRLLGTGAQSAVYLAFDPHLERDVAIKTLHFAGADQAQNRRLLQEARTVSKLRHPNIVPIFEAGEQAGDPYLVFEYVEGGTLAELLRAQGALAAARAAALMLQVLDAVAHAHAHGIVHRDLKPSNVLIDPAGAARVMDFGIASPIAGREGERDSLTGTPSYMAPEYIAERAVGPQGDIYAAGLLLYELLTGRRAVSGGDAQALMARIAAAEQVIPPAELAAAADEKLRDILAKAVARDINLRYAQAQQMQAALAAYLEGPRATEDGEGAGGTLEFLLRRMRLKSDFPALSEAVSSINRLASSDRESVGSLSNTILKDFALTNKILRLVNSAYYGSGGSISTVSRAIVVLGFEAIRNIAVSLILFEHLENQAHAHSLKEEFLRCELAGMLAKDLAQQRRDTEEAFICAMFRNLGRLLARYYFPEEAAEIRRRAAGDRRGEERAAAQVLGVCVEDLGVGVARAWGFPEGIVHSMRRLPEGPVRAPATREDRLRVLAAYADELCDAIEAAPAERAARVQKLRARFADAVPVTQEQLQEILARGAEQVRDFAAVIRLDLGRTRLGRQLLQFDQGAVAAAEDALPGTLVDAAEPTSPAAAAVQPPDAQAILAAGIQDISNSLVDDFSLNDLLRIIVETMYRALGFRRVLLCVREGRGATMAGRLGCGPDAEEAARRFRFTLGGLDDVFNIVLAKGVDLLVQDATEEKIASRIPDWYRRAVNAPTFILLPLTIRNAPVALIYADKAAANEIAISEKELSLLRTLRNQAVLAIKQSS